MFVILEENMNENLELEEVVDYITEIINTIGGTRNDMEDCIEVLEGLRDNEVLIAIEGTEQLVSLHSITNKTSKFYNEFIKRNNVYFQIEKVSV